MIESADSELAQLDGVELDPVRHPPALMRAFAEHRERWLRGEIRLENFCRGTVQVGNEKRPQWYPDPLGSRVVVDKALLFESLGYRPSEIACKAHASLGKVRVFSGGARAGKSRWAGYELLPLLLTPDTRIWIVAPEYEQARKEFEYMLEAIETDTVRQSWGRFIKAGKIRNAPAQGEMWIELKWGGGARESFVRVKSAKIKQSLLSEELDAVCVVEASEVPEGIWSRYLQMRLTTRRGVAIFPSTPSGMGWYYQLYLAGVRGDRGMFSINADSRMNPTMSLEEVAFWTSPLRMSDQDFDEQVLGIPTPKHGRVYPSFARGIHVDSWRSEWPAPSWPRGRAFDFGYQDPYVILWIARDGDGRFYVYREFYRRHVLTADVVKHIAQVEGWSFDEDEDGRVKIIGTAARREHVGAASVSDWDASERADLQRCGIRTRRANKDILPGIRTVAEFLRVQGDGRPRLFIHPRCVHLIQELESYQWGANAEPVDKDNHAVDALRYMLHTMAPYRRGKLEVRVA